MIRLMTRDDEPAVRALTALGHPDWTPKPDGWYRQHRVFVADEQGIVGYTAYDLTPEGYAVGLDVVVHPDWRGKGLGDQLHGARIIDAKAQGASYFVGSTTEEPMRKILEAWGAIKTLTTADGPAYVTRLV
mgnify:CR=1 FL=1